MTSRASSRPTAAVGRIEHGYAIHAANEQLIRSCQLLIANLSPFRGPSADVGTVYELGFARGLGLPVFGYTNVQGSFQERTLAYLGTAARRRPDGTFEDAEHLALESHDLVDNLMVDGAIHASGGAIVVVHAAPEARWTDLSGFEQCLRQAAAVVARSAR
jgi:nucleoside 2-deoxyribosyltransferase